MTDTIHTGTHERRAENDEFALKKCPSQPFMMTSPLPICARASPGLIELGKAASKDRNDVLSLKFRFFFFFSLSFSYEITSFPSFCSSGST